MEVDVVSLFVMDGADVFLGLGLLSLLDDGRGDLETVKHEAGALGVHGFKSEQAHDLPDGKQDGGRVLDGRDLDHGLAVHPLVLHVEEAIGLAGEGGGVTALPIVFDVAAFAKHGGSFRWQWQWQWAVGQDEGLGDPLPPGVPASVFNGLRTMAVVSC